MGSEDSEAGASDTIGTDLEDGARLLDVYNGQHSGVMKRPIIVTGSAGFIGSSLCTKLLERGKKVIGIDNHNDYYDPKVKEARFERLTKYSNYDSYM